MGNSPYIDGGLYRLSTKVNNLVTTQVVDFVCKFGCIRWAYELSSDNTFPTWEGIDESGALLPNPLTNPLQRGSILKR